MGFSPGRAASLAGGPKLAPRLVRRYTANTLAGKRALRKIWQTADPCGSAAFRLSKAENVAGGRAEVALGGIEIIGKHTHRRLPRVGPPGKVANKRGAQVEADRRVPRSVVFDAAPHIESEPRGFLIFVRAA